MGMAAILFNWAEPFEQIANTRLENKTFKNNTILNIYIAEGQGQIPHPQAIKL